MEGERNEVYERIPWETLERKSGDKQWLLMAIAGAIVVGALAYSFMSNRPASAPEAPPVAATVPLPVGAVDPPAAVVVPTAPVATTAASPLVVSEADLYAVDPERWIDLAAAHAEWFAAEYFTVDGSEQSAATLTALLPEGLTVPPQADGIRVFVEWVRAIEVTEMAPLRYEVAVLVRSLVSGPDDLYQRQAPTIARVTVTVGDDGPMVVLPPVIEPVPQSDRAELLLVPPPEDISARALALAGAGEVVGGAARAEGGWAVVVMAPGPDGVVRPQTVILP